MSELKQKVNSLDDYPYHLPDKPLPAGPYISYEEFLEWADEDTLAEWVDGEIEMSSPAKYKHQTIMGFLYQVIETYLEVQQLGGAVIPPPFQMKLPGKKGSGREPDLIFLAQDQLHRLEEGLVRGPANIAAEITSQESQQRDRNTKFKEYAEGGVAEYWLIDPDLNQAEFYQLAANGQYRLVPLDAEGKYYSPQLPGFWLKAEWLWQTPIVDKDEALLEIAGKLYSDHMLQKFQKRGLV